MAETNIQWADFTFNPWRGCTKVSPGCTNCYAETMSKRNPAVLGVWGDQGTRVVAAESYWRQPEKWNAEAGRSLVLDHATPNGRVLKRPRVFCASLADVFEDRPELREPRARLFRLIDKTPNLDWLLLTKRPENMARTLDELSSTPFIVHDEKAGPRQERWMTWKEMGIGFDGLWPNVWLGVSVEDQQRADERIPLLLQTPAAVRFLSVEPLLGPIEFSDVTNRSDAVQQLGKKALFGIDWVIVGGESGPKARPCQVQWVRSIVRQCRAADVKCFVKQLGSAASDEVNGIAGHALRMPEEAAPLISLRLRDTKGGDPDEWPEDLRVREFPERRG